MTLGDSAADLTCQGFSLNGGDPAGHWAQSCTERTAEPPNVPRQVSFRRAQPPTGDLNESSLLLGVQSDLNELGIELRLVGKAQLIGNLVGALTLGQLGLTDAAG